MIFLYVIFLFIPVSAQSTWVPLKIHPIYSENFLSTQPSALQDEIRELINVALKMFENSMKVRELGVRGFTMWCSYGYSKKPDGTVVCIKNPGDTISEAMESTLDCGSGFDGTPYFRSMPFCTYSANTCSDHAHQCTDCIDSPQGSLVVEDANYYIFIESVNDAMCESSTIAYAATCSVYGEVEYNRPDVGFSNICPNIVTGNMSDLDKAEFVATIWHEIAHALGFSNDQFVYFVNSDGTPKVEREVPGFLMTEPITKRTIACFDDVNTMSAVFPSEDVLCVGRKRGHPVHMICSPEVQRVTREITGCSTVEGAELNWLPSSMSNKTCFGTHWSAYVFDNTVMSADRLASNAIPQNYMKITLALFQDSGWYQVDYRFAQTNPWVDKKGCDFLENSCIQQNDASDDNWCTSEENYRCDVNHFMKAKCSIENSFPTPPISGCDQLNESLCLHHRGSDAFCMWDGKQCSFHIYPWLKHTIDGSEVYGSNAYLEYCPYRSTTIIGGNCLDPNESCDASDGYGCIHGPKSRCAVNNLLRNNQGWSQDDMHALYGTCYEMNCADDGQSFTVTALDSKGVRQTVTCVEDGAHMEFPAGFTGFIECPKRNIICPNSCPGGCTGRGPCEIVDGTPTCLCLGGYIGESCDTFDPTTWLNTDWLAMVASSQDPASDCEVKAMGCIISANRVISPDLNDMPEDGKDPGFYEQIPDVCFD